MPAPTPSRGSPSLAADPLPVNRRAAVAHLFAFCAFVALELTLRHTRAATASPAQHLAIAACLALLPVLVASLALVFVPLIRLRALGRALGSAWAYAAITTVLVLLLSELLRLSWASSTSRLGLLIQDASFGQASALLRLFYPEVLSLPGPHILGTPRFLVIISGVCSGVEGLALMGAFLLVWFIFARREIHILRALLLVPVALGLMWVFNLLRIVALIAIGNAGHPDVALNGFHTEAGWITLNLGSLAFLLTAQHLPWIRREASAAPIGHTPLVGPQESRLVHAGAGHRNVAAIYLAPFLAITAASLLSQSATSSFEWLYPLRLAAALLVLWRFRAEYRRIDWRFGWLGVGGGLGVAVLWIGTHLLTAGWALPMAGPGAVLAASLGALPPGERVLWIVLRLFAAVVTVPVAEELAFRGFLARRLVDADLEAVPYARLTVPAILGSSVAFGLMHGRLWAPGIAAGIIFALLARRRNRLGEAIAAHAVANLALAVFVLARGDFRLW